MWRSKRRFFVHPEHRLELEELGLHRLEGCLDCAAGPAVKVVKDQIPGRDVLRLERARGCYYLKRVRGKGWRDVPHEHAVLERLRRHGLPVPEPVACGSEDEQAVLVTVGLPTAATLEELLLGEPLEPARLRRLVHAVASLMRDLHGAGVNHRDFYAGHVHLDAQDRPYLVDLGRAEVRARVPRRRVVKDLAALHFSVPERVLGPRVRLRFLVAYLRGGPDRCRARRIAYLVEAKSRRMRRHSLHKLRRGEPNVHVNE